MFFFVVLPKIGYLNYCLQKYFSFPILITYWDVLTSSTSINKKTEVSKYLTAVTKTTKRHSQRHSHDISCVFRLPIHGVYRVNRWTIN